jgi:hypothetical protein
MNFRKISLTAATFAVLVPALSQAGPERDAFKACASAFASSLASPGAAAPTFKADYHLGRSTGSALDFFTREYSFDMRADDPKTRAVVARARCTTDTRGTVRALAPLPLDIEQPALATLF